MNTVDFTKRWNSGRLATLFVENAEKNLALNSINALQFRFGEIVPKPVYELSKELKDTYQKYTIVRPNDIMLNGLNLNYDFVTQRVAQVKNDGIITSAYICLRPREGVLSRYYSYLLKTMDSMKFFNGMGTGIRLTLSYNLLKNILLPIPSSDEQDQIARYLDWKVSEINKLILAKKRQVDRLGDLKKTVINDAVVHGLMPSVPMKYSGVEWLGNIPEHWSIIKLRQILQQVSVKNHPELPLLSVVREQGVIERDVEDKESNHNFIPDDLSGYKLVRKGQLAMNKMKAWQGSYGISDYTGIVSPAYFVFDVKFDNLKYFHYAIRSKVYVNFFAQASDGIRVGQWDLSLKKMKEIPFIVPPEDEQEAIVNYIPAAFAKYEAAMEKLKKEIDILHELRTKLISDTVTGQIDVRNVDIPDFEYVEEASDESYEDGEDFADNEPFDEGGDH